MTTTAPETPTAPAARPVAPPGARDAATFGPTPTPQEVEAHCGRHEPYSYAGAPWLRRYVAFDGSAVLLVEVVYLSVCDGRVRTRRPMSNVTHSLTSRDLASEWRPVDASGEAVPRG